MVLTPPANVIVTNNKVAELVQDSPALADEVSLEAATGGGHHHSGGCEKKPSYLNLACCVNGYSNLTTYDSKIRQDINKSREVSPIRPSTSSLQYCKKSNSLAAPILHDHTMPLTKQPSPVGKYAAALETNNNNGSHHENGNGHHYNGNGAAAGTPTSFIQQRVERLYGPGALAQGFYSPKKHGMSPISLRSKSGEAAASPATELARKFKQLTISPNKDYSEFRKKLDSNCARPLEPVTAQVTPPAASSAHNRDVDLPVFRHLSDEFRSQLPTVSPKRNIPRTSPAPEVVLPLANGTAASKDEVDREAVKIPSLLREEYASTTKILNSDAILPPTEKPKIVETSAPATAAAKDVVTVAVSPPKDGNYFLKILKTEQTRLLALAAVGEKYTEALTNNPDITEDTFGLLRSASGKARLLVSQKMKQFEGLCHNNLNRSPEDAFPTTLDDLQGFWDMVYLQVDHVDSIFADIEKLKNNDWKRINEPEPAAKTDNGSGPKNPKTGNSKTKLGGSSNTSVNSSKPLAASNSVAAAKREAQRKQLLEMKRQRREAMAAAAAATANQNGDEDIVDVKGDSVTNIAVKNSS